MQIETGVRDREALIAKYAEATARNPLGIIRRPLSVVLQHFREFADELSALAPVEAEPVDDPNGVLAKLGCRPGVVTWTPAPSPPAPSVGALREALETCRTAIAGYDAALARREHGDVAMDRGFRAIRAAVDAAPAIDAALRPAEAAQERQEWQSECAREALEDARAYGVGFISVSPDGTFSRLDPMDVMVRPGVPLPSKEG